MTHTYITTVVDKQKFVKVSNQLEQRTVEIDTTDVFAICVDGGFETVICRCWVRYNLGHKSVNGHGLTCLVLIANNYVAGW